MAKKETRCFDHLVDTSIFTPHVWKSEINDILYRCTPSSAIPEYPRKTCATHFPSVLSSPPKSWENHLWESRDYGYSPARDTTYSCTPLREEEKKLGWNSDSLVENFDGEGYVTKFSGEAENFNTGAHRDSQKGKPRYDLIPARPLKRVADLYARGGEVHGDKNWLNGIPNSRSMASLMRHVQDYRLGDRTEDHLAAIVWNAMALMQFEGTEFDDFDKWEKPE